MRGRTLLTIGAVLACAWLAVGCAGGNDGAGGSNAADRTSPLRDASAGARTDTSTGGAGARCHEKGLVCSMGLVCDYDQPGRCGASTAGGTCIVLPTSCPTDKSPVCGCDGKTYDNDCLRQMARQQLNHKGAC